MESTNPKWRLPIFIGSPCSKCENTSHYVMKIDGRSHDEPITVIHICTSCNQNVHQ